MGWFIFGIIVLVAAIILAIASVVLKSDRTNVSSGSWVGAAGGAVACLVVGLLLMFLSTIREVPVHSVGVESAFGKVEGDLRPGFHAWVAPWTSVNVLDETYQTVTWYAPSWNPSNTSSPGCLIVRIGGQQLACANITLKYQIVDSGAPQLFNDYDNQGTTVMDSIQANLVDNDLKTVANEVMGDYNPIEDAALSSSTSSATAQSEFSTFSPAIAAKMSADLKGEIRVISVNLSNAYYNSTTEERLASIQNQIADTAIAQQQVSTDKALSQANTALSKSLTPAVDYYTCLTITQDIYKDGENMNAGWSCGSGTDSLAISGS